MTYGLARYYRVWNANKGPNYFILDRNTGEKKGECMAADDAIKIVNTLNQKDREERGLKPLNEIEVPTFFNGRGDRTAREIAPMVKHK